MNMLNLQPGYFNDEIVLGVLHYIMLSDYLEILFSVQIHTASPYCQFVEAAQKKNWIQKLFEMSTWQASFKL